MKSTSPRGRPGSALGPRYRAVAAPLAEAVSLPADLESEGGEMKISVTSRNRRLVRVFAITGVTAAIAGAPAQAALDEGGRAQAAAPQVQVEAFDWSDAAVGIGIGAAAGIAAVGSALAVRRRRPAPHGVAGPAAR